MTDQFTHALMGEIRAEIARQSLTSKAFADEVGIPYITLRRYLNDERAPRVPEVVAIAAALGIPMHELFRRAEESLA